MLNKTALQYHELAWQNKVQGRQMLSSLANQGFFPFDGRNIRGTYIATVMSSVLPIRNDLIGKLIDVALSTNQEQVCFHLMVLITIAL